MKVKLNVFAIIICLTFSNQSIVLLEVSENKILEIKDLENSIVLFGKELVFGISAEEFISMYPEFKKYDPREMKLVGRDSDEGLEVFSYIYNNNSKIKEFDPFEKIYAIFVKFKNDSLKELEMLSGHSDEGYAIADSILTQFVLSKKETDKDLEYDKLYYTKDNLEAMSYYYETMYLNIVLKK